MSAVHHLIGPNLEADERIGPEGRGDGYIDRVATLAISTRPIHGTLLRGSKVWIIRFPFTASGAVCLMWKSKFAKILSQRKLVSAGGRRCSHNC